MKDNGTAIRVAPSRDGIPAAYFWKFWISGNEVYAQTRSFGNMAKISVHESGQIHMRMKGKNLEHLAPPLLFGDGKWLHTFELRFLLSPDALRPPPEAFKNKRALIIDLVPDAVLILNLLVGNIGTSIETHLPRELHLARPLWSATLRNQRPVILLARVLLMDQQNKDEVTFIRSKLNPKATLTDSPDEKTYVEIRHTVWDEKNGNIILIVPMGKESFRVEKKHTEDLEPAAFADSRKILISNPSKSINIKAPNGKTVGTISIENMNSELTLVKDFRVTSKLSTVTLRLNQSNLIFGSSFRNYHCFFSCTPTIDGAQPKRWEYSIYYHFDGAELKVEILQLSAGLRNSNYNGIMRNVKITEEIIIAAPIKGLTLRATKSVPESTNELIVSFLLRDI